MLKSSGGWTILRATPSRIVAWATVLVYMAGVGSAIWMERRLGLPIGYQDLMLVLGFGTFAVVGSLLVAKRPRNPVSWVMLTIGLMVGLFPTAETYAAYVITTRGTPDALAVLGAWVNAWYWVPLLALALVFLPLLFPDGHLPSRRWLPVAIIPGVAALGFLVLGGLTDTLTGQEINYTIKNPIGIKGMPPVEEHPLFGLLIFSIAIGLVGATAAVLVRFRRSRGVERQQIKWFLYSVALIPLALATASLPFVGELLFGLVIIAIPAAIGVAVLRYRLYDIDVIIRRTLIYGAMTAALALVYSGSVVVLQEFFFALTGERSQLAIVISTLVIAALFYPLRRRTQDLIDRRFYRHRYDAERASQEFATSLRNEVDLTQLTAHLVSVVQDTVQPDSVSLWLREPNIAYSSPASGEGRIGEIGDLAG